MWVCTQCGEKLEDQFQSCWKCSCPKQNSGVATDPGASQTAKWKLEYKIFRGMLASWDELFSRAAYFASELGPERVLNISHSADDSDGVVTVWYWVPEGEEGKDPR